MAAGYLIELVTINHTIFVSFRCTGVHFFLSIVFVKPSRNAEKVYYSFIIEGCVWPRDNYGYICMSSAESEYQNSRFPSYDIPQECSSYEWNQNRPWIPNYYQNQDNAEPQKRCSPTGNYPFMINIVRIMVFSKIVYSGTTEAFTKLISLKVVL